MMFFGVFFRMLVRQFTGGLKFRMRDHAFFFSRRFLFFQFGLFVFLFRSAGVNASLGSLGRCIGGGEAALLRVARGQIVLGVGDVFGERGYLFLGKIVV